MIWGVVASGADQATRTPSKMRPSTLRTSHPARKLKELSPSLQQAGRLGLVLILPPVPRFQKRYLSANWISRMEFTVEPMIPKVEIGAGPEPPPQLRLPGAANSTWLNALNISMRNSSVCDSWIGKSLVTEISWFPSHGPLSVFRPQFPNVAATGLVNAAELYQPCGLLPGRTGFTPATQLSRLAVVTKLVPPESHADVSTTEPLCSVVMVLNCQPPTTSFTAPP